ncbi:hypothetical protein GEOBRER4_n3741 [Citrifermentans bremense]|uniref:Uncharacterized protein n=1 Tax=Citrifermentans bremense TaxID=60035 RepID=A0A6S6MAH7_9BACT|nr:hypothetical protein [Citrifermentans bremense]BCG48846.1 hypothetical protein GEOBRER4_n3741 [Citrifermentans bremense]
MSHSQYQAGLSRDARHEAATQRIKEKIAILEKWCADGVPECYELSGVSDSSHKHCPKSLTDFQKWLDEDLELEVRLDGGLHVIHGVYPVSAVAMDRPERSSLKGRARELLASIKNKPSAKQELTKLKVEKRAQEVLIQRLVNENAQLRSEIMNISENVQILGNMNKNLIRRVADLEKQLDRVRTVQGLRPVK